MLEYEANRSSHTPEGLDHKNKSAVHARANYLEDVAILRMGVGELLQTHDALHDGEGWAIFTQPVTVDNASTTDSHTRTLVMHHPNPTVKGFLPDIRVFTNTVFPMRQYTDPVTLVKDITLDTDNDAQISVGPVFELQEHEREKQFKLKGPNTEILPSIGGIFTIEDTDLNITSFRMFTPRQYLGAKKNKEEDVTPFGTHNYLADKMYAVAEALHIVASCAEMEFVACSQPT